MDTATSLIGAFFVLGALVASLIFSLFPKLPRQLFLLSWVNLLTMNWHFSAQSPGPARSYSAETICRNTTAHSPVRGLKASLLGYASEARLMPVCSRGSDRSYREGHRGKSWRKKLVCTNLQQGWRLCSPTFGM